MIGHHEIHIFYIFFPPLSSIVPSGFHLIFSMDSMQKCEQTYVTPLQPRVTFLYPMKTSENLQVF